MIIVDKELIENAQHYYDEDENEMTKADMEFHRRRDEEI